MKIYFEKKQKLKYFNWNKFFFDNELNISILAKKLNIKRQSLSNYVNENKINDKLFNKIQIFLENVILEKYYINNFRELL